MDIHQIIVLAGTTVTFAIFIGAIYLAKQQARDKAK
jgi:hypothetical protein